jgi:hypothetical protein
MACSRDIGNFQNFVDKKIGHASRAIPRPPASSSLHSSFSFDDDIGIAVCKKLFRSELYTHVRRTFFLYQSDYTSPMAFLSSPDDAFRSIPSSVVNHVVIGRAAHLDVRLVIPLSIARARIKSELFGKKISLSLSLSLSLSMMMMMRIRHYPANGKDHRLPYKDDMLLEVVRTE